MLNVLEMFGSISGLRVNTEKTKIVWTGKKTYSKDKYQLNKNLEWGATEFILLGIVFSVKLESMIELNFNSAIQKIQKLFTSWNRRYLTQL